MENNSYLAALIEHLSPEVTLRVERVVNNNRRTKMSEKKSISMLHHLTLRVTSFRMCSDKLLAVMS